MASIRKRRGTFSVVYTYENENGEKKQRWETFKTYAEAHKRRAEIGFWRAFVGQTFTQAGSAQ